MVADGTASGLKKPDRGWQMVADVTADARGILAPDVGLARFRLERFTPAPPVRRLVDRYWVVHWDLPDGEHHDQHVWPHPVTNVVLEGGTATAGGVATKLFTRRLDGAGAAFGIMFRPAGFRPLLGAPVHTITDRTVPFGDVVDGAADLARSVAAAPDDAAAAATVDAFMGEVVPPTEHPAEATMRLAEAVANDRDLVRVEQLADLAGRSPRTLQRRFADHVGISPKALIRRYRLFDAAEAARRDVDWAALAATLGYADQAHLIRDFKDAIGMPPATYARAARAPV